MLKRKQELNYRKASDRRKRCKVCIRRRLTDIYSCDGNMLHQDYRCKPVGLENSRRYSIAADHVCDAFELNDITMV